MEIIKHVYIYVVLDSLIVEGGMLVAPRLVVGERETSGPM